MEQHAFNSRSRLSTKNGNVWMYHLEALEKANVCSSLATLPRSIRIVLESVLRHAGKGLVTESDVENLAKWTADTTASNETPFMPARVLMQDFTGVPAVVDLAAMRVAMKQLNGSPSRINPLIPTELVIDHSVQVDAYGSSNAQVYNEAREYERNGERYAFLKWGANAFDNFTVIPPSTGIVHQVNMEHLAKVVRLSEAGGEAVACPDTVLGTDSHTTMINSLGVLGWGVGGIEAEAAMLGQPYYMLAPQVVGVRLEGALKEGVLATDLALHVTQILRKLGVVSKFVEFYGPGAHSLSLPDRSALSNMAPEYGATMGFFPVDEKTIDYLRLTGRTEEHIDMVERYSKAQGLFASLDAPDPQFSQQIGISLTDVEPCLAGPKRPQDKVLLREMKHGFQKSFSAPVGEGGYGRPEKTIHDAQTIEIKGGKVSLTQGAVVLAAITSCTNTSNPSVLIAAGLLAKKAVEKGLAVKPYVKTSLAPGSRVVKDYLEKAGLLGYLEELGFHIVGYGCTSCIGNSGPLDAPVAKMIEETGFLSSAVLSGNRNFEGRVNPLTSANYLASPPLVVAYAIAGNVNLDLTTEPIGKGSQGDVFLKDVWPTSAEIEQTIAGNLSRDDFIERYQTNAYSSPLWNKIGGLGAELYAWDEQSTYIQEPPYFDGLRKEVPSVQNPTNLRVLGVFGNSITTDHISPAGAIMPDSPAGKFLLSKDVSRAQFNAYGSRRGNDHIMTRATFANIRLKNHMVAPQEGGWTKHFPSGEKMVIYDAAMRYKEEGVGLVVIGGKEYGTGSSRDWAAKGTMLLGVKAVLVESFERIHRSNLVGMGVLPLQFKEGENAHSLQLTGEEVIAIEGIADDMKPGIDLKIKAVQPSGKVLEFSMISRLDTAVEVDYYRNGGILQTVLRQMLAKTH